MSIPGAAGATFLTVGTEHPSSPLVLGVPHAGRLYPDALRAAAGVPIDRLAALEDPWVDRLVDGMIADGAAAVIAQNARAWLDLNRDPRELDPAMIDGDPGPVIASAKVRAGLGIVPRRAMPGAEIYRRRLPAAEVRARIAAEHAPFHAAIERALAAAHARFGVAILLDCHSMPPLQAAPGRPVADVVIGDRHGRSAANRFADAVAGIAEGLGHRVAFNHPYAGGYTLTRHGRPSEGVHALQVELSRALYLDRSLRRAGPGFGETAELVRRIGEALVGAALNGPDRLAAE